MEHIAIMDNEKIKKILNKEKLIESRFSKNKITPFHNITKKDIVYLKISGGKIIAYFEVRDVMFFEDLNEDIIKKIKEKYNDLINAPEDFWSLKKDSKYATLIFIKSAKAIEPISINKRNRQAFISCNNMEESFPLHNKKTSIRL
jgi:hypothetical protein